MLLFLTTDSSQLYKYLFKIKKEHFRWMWLSYLMQVIIFFVVVYGTLPKSVVRLSQDPFYVNTKWRNFFFSFQVFLMISKFFGDVLCSLFEKSWFGAKFHNTRAVAAFFGSKRGQESDEYLEGGVRVSTFRSDHVDHEIYLQFFFV